MQLKSFNSFVSAVIREGRRLQKFDITGRKIAKGRITQVQLISILVATASIFLFPTGFSHDFAGYTISFLGIFIGLFTSILISLFDKRDTFFKEYSNADQEIKARMKKIKNYLVQFTGLTAFSIFLAIIVVILLSVVLLRSEGLLNPFNYYFLPKEKIDFNSIVCFLKISIAIAHRWVVIYLLLNIFSITIYSITSYFSFLSSEYKNITLNDD